MHRVLLGLLLVAALGGCQPLEATVTTPTENTPAPEEGMNRPATLPDTQVSPVRADSVIAKATELVGEYFALSDAIGHSGGQLPPSLRELVTAQWYPRELDGAAVVRESNIRTLGHTRVDQLAIQSARRTVEGDLEIAVFVCVDSSAVWVVPANSPEPPEDLLQWLVDGADIEQATDDMLSQWQPYLDEVAPTAGTSEPVIVWLVGEQLSTLAIDGTENWRGHHPCGDAP